MQIQKRGIKQRKQQRRKSRDWFRNKFCHQSNRTFFMHTSNVRRSLNLGECDSISNLEGKNFSRAWFRSTDLWVMGPARFHCATLLFLQIQPPALNLQLLLFFLLLLLRNWESRQTFAPISINNPQLCSYDTFSLLLTGSASSWLLGSLCPALASRSGQGKTGLPTQLGSTV